MKLQEQMFGLIVDWYASKLFKKDFLEDKNVSQGKFDYWLKKYHSSDRLALKETKKSKPENFKEIVLPLIEVDKPEALQTIKLLELHTPKGLEITIYETC